MANAKVSQLTVITTPVDTDEMYVIQGGISLRMSLLQIFDYIEPKLDADFIFFDDPSTNGLAADNVGEALRELDDAIDLIGETPAAMPDYDFNALPDASTLPYLSVFARDTLEGDVPLYSDGVMWKYFFNNELAYGPIPTVILDIDSVPPIVGRIYYPAVNDFDLSGSAPFVIEDQIPSVDLGMTKTPPQVIPSIPVPAHQFALSSILPIVDVDPLNPIQHVPVGTALMITSIPTAVVDVVNPVQVVPTVSVAIDSVAPAVASA